MVDLRPVIDPDVPASERALLSAEPARLAPATAPAPAPSSWGGRTLGDVLAALPMATIGGFLPVAVGPLLQGGRGLAVGAAAQAGLIAAWWFSGIGTMFAAATALQLLLLAVLVGVATGEDEHAALARRHHGRYLVPDDFADGSLTSWFGVSLQRLMKRTQRAVADVLESDVNAAGLLDDTANAVALPRQEWEIAQALAELTRLAREVARVSDGATGERVREAVAPQRAALTTAASALAERVEALERYASRTRAADTAYREWRTLQELAELGDETRDVLARTVRDELAVAEIDGLADRSGLAPLRDTLAEARRAADVLTGRTA
ncbi:hypothetical protein [Actinomadura flavalba]|uniref:hypothetical protein n=1 Tax=Actinomadura flavalba TaxID=1120938 RepID=UPI00035FE0E2|nr:hypothetical protein [Actinomadura flavalba]